jgi:hypothetical protein
MLKQKTTLKADFQHPLLNFSQVRGRIWSASQTN